MYRTMCAQGLRAGGAELSTRAECSLLSSLMALESPLQYTLLARTDNTKVEATM